VDRARIAANGVRLGFAAGPADATLAGVITRRWRRLPTSSTPRPASRTATGSWRSCWPSEPHRVGRQARRQDPRTAEALPGLLMANYVATVEYEPLGVVGVIARGTTRVPPMGSIAYALARGTRWCSSRRVQPRSGRVAVRNRSDVVPEQPVLQLITGFGETVPAVPVRCGQDRRSPARQPPASAYGPRARKPSPMVIEGGGKIPAGRRGREPGRGGADAAVWGACSTRARRASPSSGVRAREGHDEFRGKGAGEGVEPARRLTDAGAKLARSPCPNS